MTTDEKLELERVREAAAELGEKVETHLIEHGAKATFTAQYGPTPGQMDKLDAELARHEREWPKEPENKGSRVYEDNDGVEEFATE